MSVYSFYKCLFFRYCVRLDSRRALVPFPQGAHILVEKTDQ